MKKTKFFAIGLAIALIGGSFASIALAKKTNAPKVANAISQDGEGYYLITNASDFATVFDGSAVYATRNVRLTSDINLASAELSGRRMAGDFTGTFDGQGFTISNFSLDTDASLFNNVGAAGVIKNTKFSWTAAGKQSSLYFSNNGLVDECVSTVTPTADAYGVWGASAFSFAPGSGTHSNLISHFVLDVDNPSGDAGTYPAALIGNNGALGTVVDCYYNISGTYAASGKVRSQNTTVVTNVTAVNITETAVEVEPGSTVDVTLTLTGNQYDSLVWSTNADSVATVVGNRHGATITGVAGGNATITVTATVGANEYTDTVAVTVSAAATDVDVVALNPSSVSIVEGDVAEMEVEFVSGTQYDSIDWEITDTNVATFELMSDKSVRITGVSAGNTTISVTVNTESGHADQTATITVTEATYLPIYMAIKDGFANLGNSGYAVWVYGGNDVQMGFPLNDTDIDVTLNEATCSVYLALVNLNVANKLNGNNIMAGVFIQLCGKVNTGDRWGAGYNVTSLDGYYFFSDFSNSSPAPVNNGSAIDFETTWTFCVDYMKAETISLDNRGETADCQANYNAAMGEVVNLTATQRKIFATTAYYERLQAWATANGESFAIDGEGAVVSSNAMTAYNKASSNVTLIVVISVSCLVLTAGVLIFIRRRKVER